MNFNLTSDKEVTIFIMTAELIRSSDNGTKVKESKMKIKVIYVQLVSVHLYISDDQKFKKIHQRLLKSKTHLLLTKVNSYFYTVDMAPRSQ